MATSGVVPVNHWTLEGDGPADDIIAGEVAVALSYNRRSHVVMMATPTDLEDFALGFSLTEGILDSAEELLAVRVIPRDTGIEVAMTVTEAAQEQLTRQRRNLTGRTGCGLCGAESLEQACRRPPRVADGLRVTNRALQAAIEGLEAHQPLQAATGAVHGVAFCSADGAIVAAREDVGRHNALDKLIGHLQRTGVHPGDGFVLVSSRASYEMVYKSATAGFELLAAVSAPTTLAVEFAREAGMTLVGFARPGRHNIYTHPHRVAGDRMKE